MFRLETVDKIAFAVQLFAGKGNQFFAFINVVEMIPRLLKCETSRKQCLQRRNALLCHPAHHKRLAAQRGVGRQRINHQLYVAAAGRKQIRPRLTVPAGTHKIVIIHARDLYVIKLAVNKIVGKCILAAAEIPHAQQRIDPRLVRQFNRFEIQYHK